MFRFKFMLLIQYSTITSVFSTSVSQNDDSSTYLYRNCSAEIDIILAFKKDLESVQDKIEIVRKRTDEIGTEIANRKSKPSSCIEAAAGSFKSGVYEIQLEKFAPTPFAVWCNEDIEYGGWLVIQRRDSGAVDFNGTWQDHKNGFGIPNGNYWLGLEKLHVITTTCEQEFYFEFITLNDKSYYGKYSEFLIGSELEGYALKKLGSFAGNADNVFRHFVGKMFTTFDRDYDEPQKNCSASFHLGMWHKNCYDCDLNGLCREENVTGTGVNWNDIVKEESVKFCANDDTSCGELLKAHVAEALLKIIRNSKQNPVYNL